MISMIDSSLPQACFHCYPRLDWHAFSPAITGVASCHSIVPVLLSDCAHGDSHCSGRIFAVAAYDTLMRVSMQIKVHLVNL